MVRKMKRLKKLKIYLRKLSKNGINEKKKNKIKKIENENQKKDFEYNVETLATCNDKKQLYDELYKLKNKDGFDLLEILIALKEYDNPTFKKQRNEILNENCERILKVELLIYDFGESFDEFSNLKEKSIREHLKDLESDRFKIKDVLKVSTFVGSSKN